MCCGLARTLPMMVTFRVLNLLLVQRFIADPPYLLRERGRVDVPGIALLALGLGALQFMLEEGQRKDWFDSSFIVTLAVAPLGSGTSSCRSCGRAWGSASSSSRSRCRW